MRERLVVELDLLTPDADLEPDLGAPEHPAHLSAAGLRRARYQSAHAPDQPNDEDREVDADMEPSLGAPEFAPRGARFGSQLAWSWGGTDDAEREHAGREPEEVA